MRNFKNFQILLITAVIAVGLTGCDVKKDVDENAALELTKTKAALAEAKAKIAALEKSYTKTQPKSPEEKPELLDLEMQKQRSAAQENTDMLAAQVKELTEENTQLQGLLEKLKASYAELEKKLKNFQSAGKNLKSDLPLTP